VAQAVIDTPLKLIPQPVYGEYYSTARDPVWRHKPTPGNVDTFAWYQCDQLGTPMELTDTDGQIAWRGNYKAWGQATEERSDTAKRKNIHNALRFQGQYFDVETGLHYNRYRYYDPRVGRFIGKDPIGFAGGVNVYQYAPSPGNWVDPLGLAANRGRFQAQGAKLEESVSWNQDDPITVADGKRLMGELKAKLTDRDLTLRRTAFEKAERFIDDACRCGGVRAQTSRSFKVKDTKGERVDVEIITGVAFKE
ncbi:RHS repeat-associated core domain-containing protein, partial [Pseudomonas cremoricolorata]|uniref:RHS repeat-associated core domain-containing protein n=1 Tax=Pseudomonas cremoricolorata TaxID=157783 RepID=UPI001B7F97FA